MRILGPGEVFGEATARFGERFADLPFFNDTDEPEVNFPVTGEPDPGDLEIGDEAVLFITKPAGYATPAGRPAAISVSRSSAMR